VSFFRTYIDPEIQKELFNRIDSLNFNLKDNDILKSISPAILYSKELVTQASARHQFIKACWARVSVVLGNGKVIYLNSNLDENKKPINAPLNINPLETENARKFRGRAGITSVNSSFKDYFMKQGTINFFVPNPNDFDEFKENFLKFGRYMLVEWGWSLPYNTILPAINADTVLKASKDIQERIRKAKGNYSAMVGVVTNYNFNQTKEGAYEGTIEISSMGRNILGQKSSGDGKIENLVGYINERLAKAEDGKDLTQKQKKIFRALENTFIRFNDAIKALPIIVENYAKDIGRKGEYQSGYSREFKTGVKGYFKNGALFLEREDIYSTTSPETGQEISSTPIITYNQDNHSNKLALVSWGWFEDFILNSFFSFQSDKVDFKTEFLSCEGFGLDASDLFPFSLQNTLCGNNENLYSLGFDSIILPGQTKEFDNSREYTEKENALGAFFLKELIDKTNKDLPPFKKEIEGKTRGNIRNMFFNVNYLMESFKESKNIESSIQNFWQKVSNDYGGFWRFSIVENPNVDGRIMVTDMNIGKVEITDVKKDLSKDTRKNQDYKVFEFPVYSKNSIVMEQTLTTSNTSEMATLAVYGSNTSLKDTSADSGQGYTALAMRALSILDNTNKEGTTTEQELERAKYDYILDNISSPIYKNLLDQGNKDFRVIGSSAKYDKDTGELIDRATGGGILFKDTQEVLKTDTNIVQDLIDNFSSGISNFFGKFSSKIKEYNEKQAEAKQAVKDELNNTFFWFSLDDKKVQIYSFKRLTMINEFKRTMLFKINKSTAEDDKSNYTAVLPVVPLQISLTLQGIGGIKIGDLFYLRYLPKKYRDYCYFMVVNVEHEISPTGWTTKLDSRMIVDIPKLVEDGYGKKEDLTLSTKIVTESISKSKLEIELNNKKSKEAREKTAEVIENTFDNITRSGVF